MQTQDLQTPALIIDLDRMERNIAQMQARCDAAGIKFRPHIKTHKNPQIARAQLDAGAVGIACQKVSEAQVFAAAGFNDILIPYNIVGEAKTAALMTLAQFNRITVSADSLEVVHGLSLAAAKDDTSLRVLVDLETTMRRTGATPYEVLKIAQAIEGDACLHFAGLMLYPSTLAERPMLLEALKLLDSVGLGVDVVSGGGIGAAREMADFPELTEIRVGTYVFNDWTTLQRGWCVPEDIALTIAATVISVHPERVILDCGSKTLSESVFDGVHGALLEYPEARIYKLSEEHAFVDIRACENPPRFGDRVHIIPAHVCVAVNLSDVMFGVRDQEVEAEMAVAARGRVW